jgi:hypothetical protein
MHKTIGNIINFSKKNIQQNLCSDDCQELLEQGELHWPIPKDSLEETRKLKTGLIDVFRWYGFVKNLA